MRLNTANKIGIKLLMVNAFVYISSSFYSPFLSSYYTKSGLNAVKIGILLTLGPLVAIFIQPLWAVLSDKTGRRKDILSLVVIGSGLSMFSYYIGKSFLTFFIASFLLAIFSVSIIPLSDAIILHTAHKHELDFSKIRLGGTVGYAIMVIIAGAVVKQRPALQFVMGFFGYMVLLIFVRIMPEEKPEKNNLTLQKTMTETEQPVQKQKAGLLHIFESKQVYFMLAFAFISQVGLSFNNSFVGVYMVRLGSSEDMIAVVNCICALSEIPVLFNITKVLRKINPMKVIMFSSILLGFRMFIISGGSVGFIMLAQALHGLTYMTIYISCATFISKNVRPENQSKGQSILTIIQTGIGSIVGNIAGGYFVDHFGLHYAYQYIALLIVSVSAAMIVFQVVNNNRSEKLAG